MVLLRAAVVAVPSGLNVQHQTSFDLSLHSTEAQHFWTSPECRFQAEPRQQYWYFGSVSFVLTPRGGLSSGAFVMHCFTANAAGEAKKHLVEKWKKLPVDAGKSPFPSSLTIGVSEAAVLSLFTQFLSKTLQIFSPIPLFPLSFSRN